MIDSGAGLYFMKIDKETVLDIMFAPYAEIVDRDCLGDMMTFMDSANHPYADRLTYEEDDYDSFVIRSQFREAYLRVIGAEFGGAIRTMMSNRIDAYHSDQIAQPE